MSHSSHMSCLSGSCLPPHRWQAQARHNLLGSSLHCLQDGPLFPGHRGQGQQGWGHWEMGVYREDGSIGKAVHREGQSQ